MTDTVFTASNDVEVTLHDDGSIYFEGPNDAIASDSAAAAREFFRHEEDQRLNRWRPPAFPDYIVHIHDGGRFVWVSKEMGGSATGAFYRGAKDTMAPHSTFAAVARAYFAAHPIRVPVLLQAQEDGTDEWFTIRTYPGDPGDRAHADASAHLLTSQDVPARVIEGEPA